MLHQLTVLLAISATIVTGYLHGVVTGRWGASEKLTAACLRLRDVPVTLGDWSSEDYEISPRELEVGEIDGYISRRYSHPDGRSVHVTLVCGQPGPVSVHTPDVCFRGAGFQPLATPRQTDVSVEDQSHGLMLCDFVKQSSSAADSRRVFWGWSSDGRWKAPENPRISFAGQPFLYKLYVLRGLDRPDESKDEDLCLDFLNLLIPELQQTLFDSM